MNFNSEVHPVPTARRPLNRLSVCLWPFGLTLPRLRSYTSFGFSKTFLVHNQLLPMPRSAEQRARRAEKKRERRAAESPASRHARQNGSR